MSRLEYLVTWLRKARVCLTLIFSPQGYAGRIMKITPWHDVLIVQAERGVFVISDRQHYLTDWEVQAINRNRFDE